MARVAWVFESYAWPINPYEDSGWNKESLLVEQNNVRSRYSSFQHTADKSGRRRVTGWIWGPSGPALRNKLQGWRSSMARATLVDHTGSTRRCFLGTLEISPVEDIQEWNKGRQTYKFTAEFIEVE